MNKTDVLVIGAGMTGLMAAEALRRQGVSVRVVDKGRGVGGRMATRRLDGAVFDHGAQFFTAEDDRFLAWVEAWQKEGVVAGWGHGFVGENGHHRLNRHRRYVGRDGMTTVPKRLARDLDVRLSMPITALIRRGGQWVATSRDGDAFQARGLMVTCPVPQAIALIRTVPDHDVDFLRRLEQVVYEPCLVLLTSLDGPSGLPEPGGLRLRNRVLAWLGDNHAKGISPRRHAVTIQADPRFSQAHYDAPSEAVIREIRDVAQPLLAARILSAQLKKWRYAEVADGWDAPYANGPSREAPMVLAGDAFGGPCVEGAALSGLTAAEWMAGALG